MEPPLHISATQEQKEQLEILKSQGLELRSKYVKIYPSPLVGIFV